MKITIDTDSILGDETTIREEVISQVVSALTLTLRKEANEILSNKLSEVLTPIIKEKIAFATEFHLDAEFEPVTEYGRKMPKTCLRDMIGELLKSQCCIKDGRFSSDRNTFTEAVQSTVREKMEQFRKEFNTLVTAALVKEAMAYAVEKFTKTLGAK